MAAEVLGARGHRGRRERAAAHAVWVSPPGSPPGEPPRARVGLARALPRLARELRCAELCLVCAARRLESALRARPPERTRSGVGGRRGGSVGGGCPGVFVINHYFEKEKLIPIIQEMRQIQENSRFLFSAHCKRTVFRLTVIGRMTRVWMSATPKMTNRKQMKSPQYASRAVGAVCISVAQRSRNSVRSTKHSMPKALV